MSQKSTSPRVLILTTAYLPQLGGSELAIKNITDRLPGVCFDLITSRPSSGELKNFPENEKIGNANVYRVGGLFSLASFLLPKNFFSVAVFFKAHQLMRKYGQYDVIHAYQASQAAGGGWLLKFKHPNIPFVVTLQEGKELNRQPLLTKFFRYLILKKADKVTAISNYLAQYVRSQNSKVPIDVIPNGVDLDKFKLKENHFGSGKIITASRLVEKNGIGDLIDAVSIVRKEFPDIGLQIIGSGPLEKKLKLQVKNLNLEGGVEFLGEISNDLLPNYLSRADIFVRPSLSEGLGISFLEAMAVGLPIIGTSVGGIPDFLKDGETGLFCEPNNPQSIAENILKLLTDEKLCQKLIHNGRKLVEEKYDWSNIAKEFGKIYYKFLT